MYAAIGVLLAMITQPLVDEPRTIAFSGHTWTVRHNEARQGPGPNWFSAGTSTVRVDARGRLHLRIRKSPRGWECAEVGLSRSLGHGTYEFDIETPPATLADNVVLGLFTYETDTREIDLEVSKWGEPEGPNSQFVVQPYERPGNRLQFPIPPLASGTTLQFTWAPDRIAFKATGKGFTKEWLYTGPDIPPVGAETARMNLWLFRGEAPADGRDQHVVISRFRFTPLSPTEPRTD